MKRNNLMNDKVIKAMSIGLAAMIAVTSTPVTALAADVDEQMPDSAKANEEIPESNTADTSIEEVKAAESSIQTVVDDVNANGVGEAGTYEVQNGESTITVDRSVVIENAAKDVAAELKEAETSLLAVDAALAAVEQYKDLNAFGEGYELLLQTYVSVAAVYGINEDGSLKLPENLDETQKAAFKYIENYYKQETIGKGSPAEKAHKIVDPVVGIVSETEANQIIDDSYEEGESIKKNADDEQKKANAAGDEANETADEAEEKFTELVGDISSATTISAANAAYENLVKTLEDANTTIEEKQAAYDAAKAAYEEYAEAYNSKKKALEDAQEAYNKAQEAYEAAVKRYNEVDINYEDKVEKIKLYNDQLKLAKSNLEAAEESLDDASTNADALVGAVNAAKEAVFTDDANKDNIDIAAAYSVAAENVGWGNEDKLFKAILKDYYLPKVEGIDENSITIASGFTKFSDDTCNYIKVTYTINGEKVEKYYNYVLENGKSLSSKNMDMIIFEKRESEIYAAEHSGDRLYDQTEVDGYIVDGKKVSKEELEKDSSIKQLGEDGLYYKISDVIDSGNLVMDSDDEGKDAEGNLTDTRTVVINGKIAEEPDSIELVDAEDGSKKIVETYKVSQTTITYHKKDTGVVVCGDRKAADDALEEALKKYGDGEVISSEVTTTTSYAPVFTETIDISSERGKTKKEVVDNVIGSELDGYYVIGNVSDKDLNEDPKNNNGKGNKTFSGSIAVTYISKEIATQETVELKCGPGPQKEEEAAEEYINNLKESGINVISYKREGKKVTYISLNESASSLSEDDMAKYGREKAEINDEYSTTAYGYKITYWGEKKESTEDVTAKTVTYTNADENAVKGYVDQNVNKDKPLVTQSEDLNASIEVINKYKRLSEEAKAAQDDVKKAQDELDSLSKVVAKYKSKDIWGVNTGRKIPSLVNEAGMSDKTLLDLAKFMEDAQKELTSAKERLAALTAQMDDVKATLASRIAFLTPTSSDDEDDSPSSGEASVYVAPAVIPVLPVATIETPVAGVAGVRRAARNAAALNPQGANEEVKATETIVKEEAENKTSSLVEDVAEDSNQSSLTTIKDEEVALAAVPEEAKKDMNWWWLAVVAVLGAAGYELYKKYEEKKLAKESIAKAINKDN